MHPWHPAALSESLSACCSNPAASCTPAPVEGNTFKVGPCKSRSRDELAEEGPSVAGRRIESRQAPTNRRGTEAGLGILQCTLQQAQSLQCRDWYTLATSHYKPASGVTDGKHAGCRVLV